MDRVARRGLLARAPGALKGGTLPKLSTFLSQLKDGPFGEKTNFRKVSQCRKTEKGDPLGFFNIHSVAKYQRNWRGTLWREKIFRKSLCRKTERGDPMGFLNTHSVAKYQRNWRGTLWREKNFRKKVSQGRKTER